MVAVAGMIHRAVTTPFMHHRLFGTTGSVNTRRVIMRLDHALNIYPLGVSVKDGISPQRGADIDGSTQ